MTTQKFIKLRQRLPSGVGDCYKISHTSEQCVSFHYWNKNGSLNFFYDRDDHYLHSCNKKVVVSFWNRNEADKLKQLQNVLYTTELTENNVYHLLEKYLKY